MVGKWAGSMEGEGGAHLRAPARCCHADQVMFFTATRLDRRDRADTQSAIRGAAMLMGMFKDFPARAEWLRRGLGACLYHARASADPCGESRRIG
jgi:hypothetical protein